MTGGQSRPPEGQQWPPISPANLMALSVNAVSCGGSPFLILSIGQDSRSWGISILAGERAPARSAQPLLRLLDSRWRRDLLELPDVALVAQSALRKLSIDRGWPIP